SEVLHVPSRGARLELVNSDPENDIGPGVAAVVFADAATAKAALKQFYAPDPEVADTVYGPALPDARARIAKLGTPVLVDRVVELHATFTKQDVDDMRENIFVTSRTPLGGDR